MINWAKGHGQYLCHTQSFSLNKLVKRIYWDSVDTVSVYSLVLRGYSAKKSTHFSSLSHSFCPHLYLYFISLMSHSFHSLYSFVSPIPFTHSFHSFNHFFHSFHSLTYSFPHSFPLLIPPTHFTHVHFPLSFISPTQFPHSPSLTHFTPLFISLTQITHSLTHSHLTLPCTFTLRYQEPFQH